MRIINIVELKSGIHSTIESYVISKAAELNPRSAKKVVDKVKAAFKIKAAANGCEDVEAALESRDWDNMNGYNILIIESEKVH